MRTLHSLLIILFACGSSSLAQSNLLESVKRNPQEAINLCRQFRKFNAKGISASSSEAIQEIAKQRQLSDI